MDLVHGIDLIALPRLEKALSLHGEKLLGKMLTPREREYCQNSHPRQQLQRIGGRIAVKEAVSKALGVGMNGLGWNMGIDWQEVELVNVGSMQPQVSLSGKAKALAEARQISQWRLSLSHDGETVVASVVGF